MLGIPLTQIAWAAALVGDGTCYESPVTETPGLQGCLEDHATGTVQNMGPACKRHDREAACCEAQKVGRGVPNELEHHRAGVVSANLWLLCTTQDSHHYHNYMPRGQDQPELGGDELCPRMILGKQCISQQKALGPGTGCPASWTAPPELPEDRLQWA